MISFISGMYILGGGSLSTISLKNLETVRKGWCICGNIANVFIVMCCQLTSRFTTLTWSPEPKSDDGCDIAAVLVSRGLL